MDLAGVRIRLTVGEAGLGQSERGRRGIGHEQVRAGADPFPDRCS